MAKAEEDWNSLEVLFEADLNAQADVVAFHAQQCAEKYLKALLVWRDATEPEHRHYLRPLLATMVTTHPQLASLGRACERLERFAVAFRYPGSNASAADAIESRKWAAQIRAEAREILGLDPQLRMDLG